MKDRDDFNRNVSTLLTRLELEQKRLRAGREIVRQMKEEILQARSHFEAFIENCDQGIAHFKLIETERQDFEKRLKNEIFSLYRMSQIKLEVIQDLIWLLNST